MSNINVIIPVFNPSAELQLILKELNSQTLKPKKIILLWTIPSGKNPDIEKKKAETYRRDNVLIEYIEQKDFDHGATRRKGMELSDSEYVLCMTQDATPYDDMLIENMRKAFDDRKVAAVYARQLPSEDAGCIEVITREFNYPDTERTQNKDTLKKYGIKTYFCSDVCAMYKKIYYNEAGGFVKKTIFNEDMLMSAALIDLGYTVKYVPEALVVHSHNYSYVKQFKRNFDMAVSHREYSEVFERVSSESEGIKLVRKTASELIKMGKIYLIPDLFIQSAFKYMGYRFGKIYDKLPKSIVMKFTMNKNYWI